MKPTPKKRPIDASRAVLFENTARWLYVTLGPNENIATFRDDPSGWGFVQRDQAKRVRPGDFVTLISNDGLTRHDACTVIKIEGEKVWLAKPLRVTVLEPQALYSDGTSEVVAQGDGYAVRGVRNGYIEDQIFRTPDAAKNEILRRKPTRN